MEARVRTGEPSARFTGTRRQVNGRAKGVVFEGQYRKGKAKGECPNTKAADLNRFLVGCALVSDLYCPGYNPRQALEKNSNLASAAARYKVDSAKITASVRAERFKKRTPVSKLLAKNGRK